MERNPYTFVVPISCGVNHPIKLNIDGKTHQVLASPGDVIFIEDGVITMTPAPERIGATGDFPNGKLNDDDEGELTMGVGVSDGRIIVQFGKPIRWMGFNVKGAEDLIASLIQAIALVDEAPNEH